MRIIPGCLVLCSCQVIFLGLVTASSAFVTPSLVGGGQLSSVTTTCREIESHLAATENSRISVSRSGAKETPLFVGLTNRRNAVLQPLIFAGGWWSSAMLLPKPFSQPANAYTPDSDPLRESLYLICRIQEATCLQERYIEKSRPPIQKMKLTLRLVDKSYRLLDQVNFVSKNHTPHTPL